MQGIGIRDELLLRYGDAADTIATSIPAPAGEPSGVAPGPDIEPVEELLKRQARALAGMNRDANSRGSDGRVEAVRRRLDDIASISMSKLYAYRYDRVPARWRFLYNDTLVLLSYVHFLRIMDRKSVDDAWNLLVMTLDRALITTGGQSAFLEQRWIEGTLQLLASLLGDDEPTDPPTKRQKTENTSFPSDEPFGRPHLSPKHECPRHKGWTLDRFETYMNEDGHPKPLVFTDLISDWPALTDRPWNSVDYLLSKTLGGRRLVPIEVGRSYVDQGWGQELTSFKSFLDKYILAEAARGDDDVPLVGYLAQHDLLQQIPSLRSDIQIPDFCWADVPPHPAGPASDKPTLDAPQLNAWFGPARTITPLHTDGYHNLLCQVVGAKYVRLYHPTATQAMRPRPVEQGVDMSNTAEVDVGVVEGWDSPGEDVDEGMLEGMRRELEGLEYWECILEAGDTLLIPMGWWHYVRSLSVSFSVSFWWN